MKICYVHEEYPEETNFGGIATYQKIMAEYFANNGDEVIVICRGKNDIDYYDNNVHVFRVKSNNDNNLIRSVKEYRMKVAKLLINLQKQNKIDIVETPDWGANTIYFEKYRKIPLVVRLHTPLKIWLKYNNNFFGKSKNLILKWENKMLNQSDILISCSNLLKEYIYEEYDLKKDIYVLSNPVNNFDFYINNDDKFNENIIFIGSLEERKGIINLANALNSVLCQKKDVIVYIIGKDTSRNSLNISSKQYMLNIIDKKYHNRIIFVGQISNNEINYYLKKAKLAIFPSIFDNFPYVVLESMCAGKYIICSDNMGISSIVKKDEKNYIFKSSSYKDLSEKILSFYKKNLPFINYNNSIIVQNECNRNLVCDKMKEYYKLAICNYNLKNDLYKKILIKAGINEKILRIENENYNLANDVKKVFTNKKVYIVKKYNYDYNFKLCDKLYSLYEKNGFNVVRPINDKVINIDGINYNVFNYIKHSNKKSLDQFLVELIKCNRKINDSANINEKLDKYYNYLSNLDKYKLKEEKKVIELFEEIKENKLLNESYLNHGDLSNSNILNHCGKYYLIDFDETIITTELYDFACIVVKHKVKNNKFKIDEIKNIIKLIDNSKYSIDDYVFIIKYFLLKILLEKFYLYEKGIIDLFDYSQKRDNYKKYILLLKEVERIYE